jgi:hypothetical protein
MGMVSDLDVDFIEGGKLFCAGRIQNFQLWADGGFRFVIIRTMRPEAEKTPAGTKKDKGKRRTLLISDMKK